jgi:SpoIID/LytB domain protein
MGSQDTGRSRFKLVARRRSLTKLSLVLAVALALLATLASPASSQNAPTGAAGPEGGVETAGLGASPFSPSGRGLTNGTVSAANTGDSFTFVGGGFGHGIGLSQYGARGMAARERKRCCACSGARGRESWATIAAPQARRGQP